MYIRVELTAKKWNYAGEITLCSFAVLMTQYLGMFVKANSDTEK
jgi:hypothetical protein